MIIDSEHPDFIWLQVSRPNRDKFHKVTKVDLSEGKVYYLKYEAFGFGKHTERVYEGPFLLWDTKRGQFWVPDAPEPEIQGEPQVIEAEEIQWGIADAAQITTAVDWGQIRVTTDTVTWTTPAPETARYDGYLEEVERTILTEQQNRVFANLYNTWFRDPVIYPTVR